MINPIRVFTEKNHASEKYWQDHLIHPIRAYWGDGTPEWDKWEKDFEFYKKYFVISDEPQNSDVAFLPFNLNYYSNNNKIDILNNFVSKMQQVDKKVFVWVEGDYDVIFEHPNCIFIKYGGSKLKSISNEIIQPGDLKNDLLKKYYDGRVQIRKKNDKPSVGFVGFADFTIIQLVLLIIKNCLKKFQYSFQNTLFESGPIIPHLVHRKATLNKINNEQKIMSNFILRKSFAEGVRNNDRNARITFIDNIINNDYTFCMRGEGNYSLRFYETLCLGRIPIFINTDCILPFHDEINWKENCIWINEPDIKNIGKKILKFHASLTEPQFIKMQHNNRKLWETYFSKPGFCHQLHLRLQNHFIA